MKSIVTEYDVSCENYSSPFDFAGGVPWNRILSRGCVEGNDDERDGSGEDVTNF